MTAVKIRDMMIGEGIPKICVPIMGMTRQEVLSEALTITKSPADMAEWRIDWYEGLPDHEDFLHTLAKLRRILQNMPLILTFRTAREGGRKAVSPEDYAALNIMAARTGLADLIDVEAFTGDALVRRIIEEVHKAGAAVIASCHDFEKTPAKEEIISRLCRMQALDADIIKIAVMPKKAGDVLTLLSATEEMAAAYADRPLVTMSMGGSGMISRLCGEVFGSSITFGSLKQASAPGQIGADQLSSFLHLLHEGL